MSHPIPGGVGTGVGSMPGTDAREAAAIVNGELDFAHLAELPARGPGADMIGRMAAVLVDLPMDSSVWGYRLVTGRSAVARRAHDFLATDLDAVEELWDTAGFLGTGRLFKIQVCGPFTLSASAELPAGHKVLRDRGAWRDVVASTGEGIANLVDEVSRRLGAQVVVQLDEPMLSRVIDGTVTPLTRFDPIAAVPVPEVATALSDIVSLLDCPVIVHSCARPCWDLVGRLPGVAWSLDVTSPATDDLDGIGALVDRGDTLVAGAVSAVSGDHECRTPSAETVATGLATLVDRIGLDRKVLAHQVIVSPTCGVSAGTPGWATRVLGTVARAGELLAEDPEALG